jgi:hypothetical protein
MVTPQSIKEKNLQILRDSGKSKSRPQLLFPVFRLGRRHPIIVPVPLYVS